MLRSRFPAHNRDAVGIANYLYTGRCPGRLRRRKEILSSRRCRNEKRIGGCLIFNRRLADHWIVFRRNRDLAGYLLPKQPSVFVGRPMAKIGLNRDTEKEDGNDENCFA